MVCSSHISCPPSKGVWLPLITQIGINLHLKQHPYCEECGVVKNIGGDRARSIGFYTNVLIDMKDHINNKHKNIPKLTQTQIRLIAKELETNDLFKDPYGTNLDIQRNQFVEEVRKYRPDFTEDFIKRFIWIKNEINSSNNWCAPINYESNGLRYVWEEGCYKQRKLFWY